MNQADEKRVPDGGWIWDKRDDDQYYIGPTNGEVWLEATEEHIAKMVVGSFNAAVLRRNFGWPSTKRPLSNEGLQIERDIDFWLEYSKIDTKKKPRV